MLNEVPLHPIAAALSASLVLSADGTSVGFPLAAIEKARAQLRSTRDKDAVTNLIALAVKIKRISGSRVGAAAIIAIGLLIVEKVGSVDDARDRFAQAGLDEEAAALLGTVQAARAPREQPKPAPQVTAKRGLPRDA